MKLEHASTAVIITSLVVAVPATLLGIWFIIDVVMLGGAGWTLGGIIGRFVITVFAAFFTTGFFASHSY